MPTEPTTDSDRLEELLQLAASEPAHRPEFFRALVEATVHVIGHTDPPRLGGAMVPAGARIVLQHWRARDGGKVFPFFTSQDALSQAITTEVSSLALPARTLFELTQGERLVLNPGSPYGKEFLPAEIQSLLRTGGTAQPEAYVLQEATQAAISQPKDYPSAMVSSLTTLLSKHANVRAAYLASILIPNIDPAPHLLVGLEVDGDPARVIQDAGAVARDAGRPEPVDVVVLERGDDGLSRQVLEQVEPFYERSWGGKLSAVSRPGHA